MLTVAVKLYSVFFKFLLKHRLQNRIQAPSDDNNQFGMTSRPEESIAAANPSLRGLPPRIFISIRSPRFLFESFCPIRPARGPCFPTEIILRRDGRLGTDILQVLPLSSRISVRPFKLSDVADFTSWAGDDRVTRYLRWNTITSREEAVKYLTEVAESLFQVYKPTPLLQCPYTYLPTTLFGCSENGIYF